MIIMINFYVLEGHGPFFIIKTTIRETMIYFCLPIRSTSAHQRMLPLLIKEI